MDFERVAPALTALAPAALVAAGVWTGMTPAIADDTPTSATLMVSVTNFEGVPQPDVAISIRRAGATTSVRSNDYGQASVALDSPRETIEARVADARFVAGAPIIQQTLTGPVMSFRVFPADSRRLHGAEREAFVRELPDVLADAASTSSTLPLVNSNGTLTPEGTSLFLSKRPHGLVAPAPAASEPDNAGADAAITALSTRLLGPRGEPVGGVLVYLLQLDPARREVTTVSWQRSDATGLVLFEDVAPGAYYRLMVAPAESGYEARSTIVRAVDGRAVTVPPLVLRAPSQTVSGFVYEDDVPASATLVVITDREGREVLRAATDNAGFFSLGPVVDTGTATRLGVRRSTRKGVRTATVHVDPSAGDVLVPLDLLAAPTR